MSPSRREVEAEYNYKAFNIYITKTFMSFTYDIHLFLILYILYNRQY
jgi:hypothetical protein